MNWNWKILTQTNNYQKATFPPGGKPPKPGKPTENFGNDSNKKSQYSINPSTQSSSV